MCCLNIPSSDLVTVTKYKTNARTLESTVIFKTNLTSARPPQAKYVFCIGTSGYKTLKTKDRIFLVLLQWVNPKQSSETNQTESKIWSRYCHQLIALRERIFGMKPSTHKISSSVKHSRQIVHAMSFCHFNSVFFANASYKCKFKTFLLRLHNNRNVYKANK